MESLDLQVALGMVAWVVSFCFGKHLQAGWAAMRARHERGQ
jgi:hypothetical protein